MSVLSSVVSVPSLRDWQSPPCWRWGTVTESGDSRTVVPMFLKTATDTVYIAHYGILMLYRRKWFQVMTELGNISRTSKTIGAPGFERTCYLAWRKLTSTSAPEEAATKFFDNYGTQEGTLPWAGKAWSYNSVFFFLLALAWLKSNWGGRAKGH